MKKIAKKGSIDRSEAADAKIAKREAAAKPKKNLFIGTPKSCI